MGDKVKHLNQWPDLLDDQSTHSSQQNVWAHLKDYRPKSTHARHSAGRPSRKLMAELALERKSCWFIRK